MRIYTLFAAHARQKQSSAVHSERKDVKLFSSPSSPLKCSDIFHLYWSQYSSQDGALSIYLLLHMEGQFRTVIICVGGVKPAVQNEICVVLVETMTVLRLVLSHLSCIVPTLRKSLGCPCACPLYCCDSDISLLWRGKIKRSVHNSRHRVARFPPRCLCGEHAWRNVLRALCLLEPHLNASLHLNHRQLSSALTRHLRSIFAKEVCLTLPQLYLPVFLPNLSGIKGFQQHRSRAVTVLMASKRIIIATIRQKVCFQRDQHFSCFTDSLFAFFPAPVHFVHAYLLLKSFAVVIATNSYLFRPCLAVPLLNKLFKTLLFCTFYK